MFVTNVVVKGRDIGRAISGWRRALPDQSGVVRSCIGLVAIVNTRRWSVNDPADRAAPLMLMKP
jgi:hypothetical protein